MTINAEHGSDPRRPESIEYKPNWFDFKKHTRNDARTEVWLKIGLQNLEYMVLLLEFKLCFWFIALGRVTQIHI